MCIPWPQSWPCIDSPQTRNHEHLQLHLGPRILERIALAQQRAHLPPNSPFSYFFQERKKLWKKHQKSMPSFLEIFQADLEEQKSLGRIPDPPMLISPDAIRDVVNQII